MIRILFKLSGLSMFVLISMKKMIIVMIFARSLCLSFCCQKSPFLGEGTL